MNRRSFSALAIGLLCGFAAHAQEFPTEAVRTVTPFPAGAGPEAVVRVLADIEAALAEPDFKERFATFGYDSFPATREQSLD